MLCRITGKMCTVWSETAGCGLIRCKFVEEKGGDKRVTDSRKNCPMRHENGNCTVAATSAPWWMFQACADLRIGGDPQ